MHRVSLRTYVDVLERRRSSGWLTMHLTRCTGLYGLYVYLHSMFIVTSLCVCHPHSTIYYTLHVLDSMFIVTLCLSSIIIHVLLSMASYRRTRLRGNPKSSNLTSRSYTRPRQCPQRVAREPCGNPQSCNFTSRSCARPRQSRQPPKSCNFTSRSGARPRQSTQRVARHA